MTDKSQPNDENWYWVLVNVAPDAYRLLQETALALNMTEEEFVVAAIQEKTDRYKVQRS